MQKETNVKTRPTKKEVVAMLEAKGVEQSIVQSLARANIDTMLWVLSKLR
jgi:hypothetical protein